MGFYFNTFRQQLGDKAYNEQKYEEALKHYSEALNTLNLHAATRNALHNDFYDALVYVRSDIIITKLMLIRSKAQELNFDIMTNYWQEIPGLLYEMELTYNEHLTKSTRSFSHKDQVIKKVNESLITICEEISDELVDQLEEATHQTQSDAILSQAIEWMNRAINFQVKEGHGPKLSSSLGYLNLLERRYKETGEESNLRIMSHYIEKHKLLEITIKSPLRNLELLSYVARLALFNHQDTSELTEECRRLYVLIPEEEKDNPILDDLQSLLNLIPRNGAEEERELEAMDQTNDTDFIEVIEEGSGFTTSALEKFDSDVNTSMMDFQNVSIEPPQSHTPIHPSANPFNTSDHIVAHSSSINQPLFGVPGSSRASQLGFFSTSSSVQPLKEFSYSNAFQAALVKITANSTNPNFLANLLSLIADFFEEYRASGIQKQNAIILAYDLYQQVLTIDPMHHRASVKRNELRSQHSKLIGAYQSYSRSSSPILATQIEEAKNCLNRTVEELTIQLESLLMNDPEKIQHTLNGLIHFIGTKLTKGVITTTPSPEISTMLRQTFHEKLQELGHPDAVTPQFF
ncbi:hypothetical protein EP47_13490 [Legionella norrlandica]|uniref:Uncharacterized protein n=1 Tax=Legionella norrlandica TaxID=1498499 RepID=A0A0A2STC3_9GAMM|nr:hypothetical protein [Legionella norrlandica]KGP62714.1 hypothetical protein EP47_13490 [Legionella norrlandica]